MPGLLRARRRLRPRLAQDDGEARRRPTTSSTARRPGRRWRSTPTGSSASCAPIPAAKKQEGISFLLIDMKSPGITVRPIQTIDGGHEVNEVFFDDVRVPAENLVGAGEPGLGLRQVPARQRAHRHRPHRHLEGAPAAHPASSPRLERSGETPLIETPRFREKLAAVEIELKALEMTQLRVVAAEGRPRRGKPDPASSRSSRSRARRSSRRRPSCCWRSSAPTPCPTGRSRTRARTSRRSARNGRRPRRRPISTGARSRSTAARTRSRRTSSPRRSSGFERRSHHGGSGGVMDFDLSEEQRLLKDSVERLLADRYDFERRKRYRAASDGFSRAMWAQLCRARPARPAVRRGAWRLRRRRRRDDDRHGGVRPRARRRALSCDGDPRRRRCCGTAATRSRRLPSPRHRRPASAASRSRMPSGSRATTLPTSRRPRGATAAATCSTATKSARARTATAPTRFSSPRAPRAGSGDRDGIGALPRRREALPA